MCFTRRRQLQGRQHPVETDASLQVESESGKRSKIKRANTLFTFAAPEPAALMSQAAAAAEALDLQFLWECAPQENSIPRPGRRLFRPRPHAGRTGRAADATARRARLFPPPRQGPLSPRPPTSWPPRWPRWKSSVRPSSSRNGSMKWPPPPAKIAQAAESLLVRPDKIPSSGRRWTQPAPSWARRPTACCWTWAPGRTHWRCTSAASWR